MSTCCNNCKWLSPSGRPGGDEKPFCLKNRRTSILLSSVFCDYLEVCPDYDDLRRAKAEIRRFVECALDAIVGHFSANDLVIQDLQTRLSRLEVDLGVRDQPKPVTLPPSEPEVSTPQVNSSDQKPSMEPTIKRFPETQVRFKPFKPEQEIGAIHILAFLLPRPNDSRNTNFLATKAKLSFGATQRVIQGLIQRRLLIEVKLAKKKVWFGVNPEKLSEVEAWIKRHTPEGSTIPESEPPKPTLSVCPSNQLTKKVQKHIEPPPGSPIAKIQKLGEFKYELTYPDGKVKHCTRHRDLRYSAWDDGFRVENLPDKSVEVTYLDSRRESHRARSR